jgi:hypothetical protein
VIALVSWIVRLVVILLLLRFLLRFLASVIHGYRGTPARAAGPRAEPAATEMVRDRVCDTFLPRSRALVAVVDGKEQHFCSPACRDRARALAST